MKKGNLQIVFARLGLEALIPEIANVAQTYLKLIREHGVLLFYGRKPGTCTYVVEIDISRGYPLPKLTLII